MRYWRKTNIIQQIGVIAAAVGMLLKIVAVFLLIVFMVDPTILTVVGIGLIIFAIVLFMADMVFAGIRRTIILRGLLNQMRDPLRRKRLLAIEELRRLGWLKDGSLHGIDLSGVDLQGANLGGASLRDANLRDANLRGVDLHWADLSGADLSRVDMLGANMVWANLSETHGITDEMLASLYLLRRAILPDGNWYDGRYNLLGDLNDAARDRVNTSRIEELARWYEVSSEAARAGQQWAEQHPDIVQVAALSKTA